ncbi:phosphotransferase family protein [Kordiimonas laminariae]|uniref:phosphotransferase family protein n=1 Tax=Kordiimonas laminariae TaxID=2917717 RepID=UPI001FF136F0|nr:phosphotransferase family protein [Kordiimonas laminariae]MCK0069735.1 phosphotransferase family protein [Kordiimonas laminariae]
MSELNKTVAVREGEELDAGLIDGILKERIEGLEGTPEIRQFASGQSNLTYSIAYANRSLVLRRPPFGTVPKSGHSMIREYSVMNALKPVYGAVPNTHFHVPAEGSPLGAEFYVMDLVAGRKLERKIPAEWNFTTEDTRKLGLSFFDKLIELHKVDFKAIGLGDFGRPEGYVERQVLGWNKRYEKAMTDDVQDFADVRKWLEENMPKAEVGHSILHGDYRLDNVILCEENPFEIKAVLDWEISALGDPLMDLGNTLAYWTQADDPEGMKAMSMQPSFAEGMPTRAEICEIYARETGYDLSNFNYYYVYGVFRLAVILQQIYYRYFHGQTKNKNFAGFGVQVDILGNYARQLIEKPGM